MTTIAVLADVHGNLPALEAVVEEIDRLRPDEVLVGGDLVGRGPAGSRVVHLIRERGWPGVRGNHEDYLLQFRRGEVPEEWQAADEWAASRWMAEELDQAAADYIAGLPFTLASALDPDLTLIHGTLDSHSEGLGPWSSDGELESQLRRAGGGLLVCGHTHRPMDRRLHGGRVVNVGSVGLPFNRDRRAQYALFHRAEGAWRVELRQVEYDLERTLAIYEESGFLAAGGATSRLLRLELEHAAPFLVPFQIWARSRRLPQQADRIGEFLEIYDPSLPLRELFGRLRRTG